MKVAFHFDGDAEELEGLYSTKIFDRFFRVLLANTFPRTHLKIFHGDLLLDTYLRDEPPRQKTGWLVEPEHAVWKAMNTDRFAEALVATNIYVIAADGMTAELRDFLHGQLAQDKTYLGAIQVYSANTVQWMLYDYSLPPVYRYVDGHLRVFHQAGEEYEHLWLVELWKTLPFKSVTFEDLGGRYTIFDKYTTSEHARRVAILSKAMPAEFMEAMEEILLRIGDLNAALHDKLYAAYERITSASTVEETAQGSLSCRRLLEGLADVLYPAKNRKETVNDHEILQFNYRDRLNAYVRECLTKQDGSIAMQPPQEFRRRIKRLDHLANKGLHDEVGISDARMLFFELLVLVYDLLQLRPPPHELPSIALRKEEIRQLIKAVQRGNPGEGGTGCTRPTQE